MIKEQNEKMALMQEEISDLKKQVTSLNEKITSKKKNGNIVIPNGLSVSFCF